MGIIIYIGKIEYMYCLNWIWVKLKMCKVNILNIDNLYEFE